MKHHFAHLQNIYVNVGQFVPKGFKIATLGKSGTKSAHLHYEVQKVFRGWTAYTQRLSKTKVLEYYENPYNQDWRSITKFTHLGWDWLSDIGGGQLHPGIDINGGAGDSDLGQEIRSPVSGIVEYIGTNESGWGNHLFIEEGVQNMALPEEKYRGELYQFNNFRPSDVFYHIKDPETADKFFPGYSGLIQHVDIPKIVEVKEIIKEVEKLVEIKVPVEVIKEIEKIVYKEKELTNKDKGDIALEYIKNLFQSILERFRIKKKGKE